MQLNLDAFTFLNDQEFMPGWCQVSLEEIQGCLTELMALGLGPDDSPAVFQTVEVFDSLLNGLKAGVVGQFDDTNVLTIHADENSMVDVVLGPAIFKNEDGSMVIKAGSNLFSFSGKGTEGICGGLTGDIEVMERDGKNENGEDEKYLSVSWDVYFPSPIDQTIEIPLVLDPEHKVSKGKFKQDLKANSISQYLRSVPSGGNWVSMNDLQIGEYLLTALSENPPHPEYGVSWTMTLEGVGDVRSKGKRFQKLLEDNAPKFQKFLADGNPVTLLVSSRKEMAQGVQVNAALFTRAPKTNRLVTSAKPAQALKPATVSSLEPAIEVEAVTTALF